MQQVDDHRSDSHSVHWTDVDLDRLQEFVGLVVQHAGNDLCVGLVGTLGAGKTQLVQCVARELGVPDGEVTSPTFALVQTYSGNHDGQPVELHHVDAYRIADEDEWFETGLEELLQEDLQAFGPSSQLNTSQHNDVAKQSDGERIRSWRFVEWADRFEHLMPPSTLWVRIAPHPNHDQCRIVSVHSQDDRHQELLRTLRCHE